MLGVAVIVELIFSRYFLLPSSQTTINPTISSLPPSLPPSF